MEVFKDWIEGFFSRTNQKVIFICGDFNIDLLNPTKHKMTDEFINTMYSMSLYPKITRPSRITPHCATLIDNIFTNDIDIDTVGGLLINDISDHLPVFTVYDNNYKRNQPEEKQKYSRVRTEETMNALKNDLLPQNWEIVYKEIDVETAYNTFLRLFTTLYDKNCPIIQYRRKRKYTDKPWITKGLQNAYKMLIKRKIHYIENL